MTKNSSTEAETRLMASPRERNSTPLPSRRSTLAPMAASRRLHPMLKPDALPALQAALAALAEPVDGWLLFDFRGINPIMAAVVGDEIVGSRRAYVYLPRSGTPVALVHGVDAELWRDWPAAWRRVVWVRRGGGLCEVAAAGGGGGGG